MTTRNFEALIYTPSRSIAALCAIALCDLPIDWMLADTTSQARRYLAEDKFDFVLIDFESESAEDLLLASTATRALVLAVTSLPVDARILCLSHEHRFYYPVRPNEIFGFLQSLSALAEHLATVAPADKISPSPAPPVPSTRAARLRRARSKKEWLASLEGELNGDLLAPQQSVTRHSLSIVAQEWLASLLAAAGSIWLVNEVTADFRGVGTLGPPAQGPIELIVIALLLWVCAKHRRVTAVQEPATCIS